jgi:hypothetical protein
VWYFNHLRSSRILCFGSPVTSLLYWEIYSPKLIVFFLLVLNVYQSSLNTILSFFFFPPHVDLNFIPGLSTVSPTTLGLSYLVHFTHKRRYIYIYIYTRYILLALIKEICPASCTYLVQGDIFISRTYHITENVFKYVLIVRGSLGLSSQPSLL